MLLNNSPMFGNVSRVPHKSLFKVRNYLAWIESWDAIEKTVENSGQLTISFLATYLDLYKKKKHLYCLLNSKYANEKYP